MTSLSKTKHACLFKKTPLSRIHGAIVEHSAGAGFTTYHRIAVRHQSDRHDVTQQDPGREEHFTEEKSAGGT